MPRLVVPEVAGVLRELKGQCFQAANPYRATAYLKAAEFVAALAISLSGLAFV